MNLHSFDRSLVWPDKVTAYSLRGFILDQLEVEGELLRWAITAVKRDDSEKHRIYIEAIILSP